MQEEPLLSDLRDEDKALLFELIKSPQRNFYNSRYAPNDWESFCVWFDAIGQDNSKRVLRALSRLRKTLPAALP